MRTLLIGGARSGKSSLAAKWADERSPDVCCVVTGIASDPEMAARIAAHRRERPAHWRVREEPVRLGWALREETRVPHRSPHRSPGVVLVDCLTLWTSNCLWPPGAGPELQLDLAGWHRERDDFLEAVTACREEVIIVTNEVGTGIVPAHEAARVFCDEHGWLNQSVAAVCDQVFLVTAGLPLRLK